MRKIVVTRQEGRWWDLPWTAWLYEDEVFITLAVASTRDGAIRSLRSRIRNLDRPKPRILSSEEVPYE